MSDEADPAAAGWFAAVDGADGAPDRDDAAAAVRDGAAPEPRDWPALAVERHVAADADAYYDLLHEATVAAADAAVREQEGAADRQLVHALRAMDDCERTANELAERVAEWAGSRYGEDGAGIEYAREVAERDPEDPGEERLVALASRAAGLADEADALRTGIERTAPEVAPNLSRLAGPVLAARLISLAGGLGDLAKSPASTVQVLGAEDALFAHLRGEAPSPKHGAIFAHEYVRGTHPEHRGSAARAVAGKLTLAARVDHYSGELKPELEEQLEERMRTIRARTDDPSSGADGGEDA